MDVFFVYTYCYLYIYCCNKRNRRSTFYLGCMRGRFGCKTYITTVNSRPRHHSIGKHVPQSCGGSPLPLLPRTHGRPMVLRQLTISWGWSSADLAQGAVKSVTKKWGKGWQVKLIKSPSNFIAVTRRLKRG